MNTWIKIVFSKIQLENSLSCGASGKLGNGILAAEDWNYMIFLSGTIILGGILVLAKEDPTTSACEKQ